MKTALAIFVLASALLAQGQQTSPPAAPDEVEFSIKVTRGGVATTATYELNPTMIGVFNVAMHQLGYVVGQLEERGIAWLRATMENFAGRPEWNPAAKAEAEAAAAKIQQAAKDAAKPRERKGDGKK